MPLPLPSLSPDHIHPILVNFTAALVPASVASDVAGRVLQRYSLHNAAWWMLVYAAAVTPLTVLSGLWWKSKVSDMLPPALLREHLVLGITLACLLPVMAWWRWKIDRAGDAPHAAYFALALLVTGLLVIQGSLGGMMLMGS